MAHSRIMLTCKKCGGQICIGKKFVGAYYSVNEKLLETINDFYENHEDCLQPEDLVWTDAKDYFMILEEGDDPKEFINTIQEEQGENDE